MNKYYLSRYIISFILLVECLVFGMEEQDTPVRIGQSKNGVRRVTFATQVEFSDGDKTNKKLPLKPTCEAIPTKQGFSIWEPINTEFAHIQKQIKKKLEEFRKSIPVEQINALETLIINCESIDCIMDQADKLYDQYYDSDIVRNELVTLLMHLRVLKKLDVYTVNLPAQTKKTINCRRFCHSCVQNSPAGCDIALKLHKLALLIKTIGDHESLPLQIANMQECISQLDLTELKDRIKVLSDSLQKVSMKSAYQHELLSARAITQSLVDLIKYFTKKH